MAKPNPRGFNYRYNQLATWGFTHKEATEFANAYSMKQLRSLPYTVNMIRARILYAGNLFRAGITGRRFRERIQALYDSKGWADEWAMLRSYRKEISATGGEPSPGTAPSKGSHHKKGTGWSAGDRQGQKARRAQRSRQKALDDNEQAIIRAINSGNQAERERLERERDRLQGNT